MDANRRAEIIQAVEWHGRDLLAEIAELEAERDMLKAAIATPELYVGVVEKVLAEERESVVAENSKLRARLERMVAAANEAKEELEYDITNCRVAIDILKAAVAEAKEVIP